MTDHLNINFTGGKTPSNITFQFGEDQRVAAFGVDPSRTEMTNIETPPPYVEGAGNPELTNTVDDDGYAGHICATGISNSPVPSEIHAKIYHDEVNLPLSGSLTLPSGTVQGTIDGSGNWSFSNIGDVWHSPAYYRGENWLVIYGRITTSSGPKYFALEQIRVGARVATTTECSTEPSSGSVTTNESIAQAVWFHEALRATVRIGSKAFSFLPTEFTFQPAGIGLWEAHVGDGEKRCDFGLEQVGNRLLLSTTATLNANQGLIAESYDPLELVWDVRLQDGFFRLTVTE